MGVCSFLLETCLKYPSIWFLQVVVGLDLAQSWFNCCCVKLVLIFRRQLFIHFIKEQRIAFFSLFLITPLCNTSCSPHEITSTRTRIYRFTHHLLYQLFLLHLPHSNSPDQLLGISIPFVFARKINNDKSGMRQRHSRKQEIEKGVSEAKEVAIVFGWEVGGWRWDDGISGDTYFINKWMFIIGGL